MQRKGLVQTGDLEDLDDLVLSHHDREVTASGAHPLEPLHQDTEARGVQEVHLFHVHHEVDGACINQIHDGLAQPRRGVDIDLSAHGENRLAVAFGGLELQIHGAVSLAPTSFRTSRSVELSKASTKTRPRAVDKPHFARYPATAMRPAPQTQPAPDDDAPASADLEAPAQPGRARPPARHQRAQRLGSASGQ